MFNFTGRNRSPILLSTFFAPKANLVIEVDGGQHQEENQKEVDRERDAQLSELGLVVLRFSNLQVLSETEAVVEEIERVVRKSPPPGLALDS